MKKLKRILLLLVLIFSAFSCTYQTEENLFFEDLKLYANLVPDLPKPKDASIVLIDKQRVYIDSNVSYEEYFQEVMEYVESLDFTFCGTAESIKEYNYILGKETSYYFSSTKELTLKSINNYYFEEENSYIVIYSNSYIEDKDNGKYLKDAHLIRVCCDSGIYEPKSHINDNYRFEYDYYIEFGYEPSIWINDSSDYYMLEISDGSDYLTDNSSKYNTYYKRGTKLYFYTNPILDANLVMYENDEFYKKQTSIENGDGYIWLFSYIMPSYDVTLKFEIETIEYLNIGTILDIPSISFNDVIKVKKEKGYGAVAPGSLKNIYYSRDYEDISNVLNMLEMVVYEDTTNSWQIAGGWYISYSIITKEKQYDIYIYNGYIYANDKHYVYIGEYVSFEYLSLSAYSFVSYQDSFEAYNINDEKMGSFNGLSDYEFVDYSYATFPDNEMLGYLDTDFGIIYILSDDIFYIEYNNTYFYYLVVGDKKFNTIFTK